MIPRCLPNRRWRRDGPSSGSTSVLLEICTRRRHGASSTSIPFQIAITKGHGASFPSKSTPGGGTGPQASGLLLHYLHVPRFQCKEEQAHLHLCSPLFQRRQDLSHSCSPRFWCHEDKIFSTSAHPDFDADPSTLIHCDFNARKHNPFTTFLHPDFPPC